MPKDKAIPEPKENEIVHALAIKRFGRIMDLEKEERNHAINDRRFLNKYDGQWEDLAIKGRENRPRYTIDRISPAKDQIVGDQRQGNIGVNIFPYGSQVEQTDKNDEERADIFDGLIREIQDRSKARCIYDSAFDEMVEGGYGGWRVLTRFNDDDAFKQDIFVEPIYSAESTLFFDPDAKHYDKRDARFAFLVEDILIDDFKIRYPEASATDFADSLNRQGARRHWIREDNNEVVRIAEYWVKMPIKKTIALLSDGRTIDMEKEKDVLDELQTDTVQPDGILVPGVKIIQEREVESHEVVSYLMNGLEVIKGPQRWIGKHIPLIPVFGKMAHVEGKVYVRGIVRKSIDAQRIYNYATSANVEAVALAPKDPYWVTPTQMEGLNEDYKRFLVSQSPFMRFNPDPENPGPPKRTGGPAVQTAFLQQIQQSATDLHATTGIEPASLGNSPELRSGKAIERQQAMGDRGSFIYIDNLDKSIEYTGEILVDLIPKIYDNDRIIRILKIDGTTQSVRINQKIIDVQSGKEKIVNDLSQGRYGVKKSSGPSHATRRRESAEQLIQLATGSPVFERLAMDLIARDLDILENDVLHKRIRRMMLMDGIIPLEDATDEEREELGLDKPREPDPEQQALLDNVLLQNTKLEADIENKDADTQSKLVKSQQSTIEALSEMIDALKSQIEAGFPPSPQQQDNLVKQNDLVAESQQTTSPGPNTDQEQEIVQNLTTTQV